MSPDIFVDETEIHSTDDPIPKAHENEGDWDGIDAQEGDSLSISKMGDDPEVNSSTADRAAADQTEIEAMEAEEQMENEAEEQMENEAEEQMENEAEEQMENDAEEQIEMEAKVIGPASQDDHIDHTDNAAENLANSNNDDSIPAVETVSRPFLDSPREVSPHVADDAPEPPVALAPSGAAPGDVMVRDLTSPGPDGSVSHPDVLAAITAYFASKSVGDLLTMDVMPVQVRWRCGAGIKCWLGYIFAPLRKKVPSFEAKFTHELDEASGVKTRFMEDGVCAPYESKIPRKGVTYCSVSLTELEPEHVEEPEPVPEPKPKPIKKKEVPPPPPPPPPKPEKEKKSKQECPPKVKVKQEKVEPATAALRPASSARREPSGEISAAKPTGTAFGAVIQAQIAARQAAERRKAQELAEAVELSRLEKLKEATVRRAEAERKEIIKRGTTESREAPKAKAQEPSAAKERPAAVAPPSSTGAPPVILRRFTASEMALELLNKEKRAAAPPSQHTAETEEARTARRAKDEAERAAKEAQRRAAETAAAAKAKSTAEWHAKVTADVRKAKEDYELRTRDARRAKEDAERAAREEEAARRLREEAAAARRAKEDAERAAKEEAAKKAAAPAAPITLSFKEKLAARKAAAAAGLQPEPTIGVSPVVTTAASTAPDAAKPAEHSAPARPGLVSGPGPKKMGISEVIDQQRLLLEAVKIKERQRRTIHIHGLDGDATPTAHRLLFDKGGVVSKVRVFNEPGGQCYAHVEYAAVASAEKMIEEIRNMRHASRSCRLLAKKAVEAIMDYDEKDAQPGVACMFGGGPQAGVLGAGAKPLLEQRTEGEEGVVRTKYGVVGEKWEVHPLSIPPPCIPEEVIESRPPSVLVTPVPSLRTKAGKSSTSSSFLPIIISIALGEALGRTVGPTVICGNLARVSMPSISTEKAALGLGSFTCLGEELCIIVNDRVIDSPSSPKEPEPPLAPKGRLSSERSKTTGTSAGGNVSDDDATGAYRPSTPSDRTESSRSSVKINERTRRRTRSSSYTSRSPSDRRSLSDRRRSPSDRRRSPNDRRRSPSSRRRSLSDRRRSPIDRRRSPSSRRRSLSDRRRSASSRSSTSFLDDRRRSPVRRGRSSPAASDRSSSSSPPRRRLRTKV